MPYIIEPEVSGQLGEKTIIDTTIHPPIVKHLHFVFYGWLGDDLLECFPVFLITERLKLKLHESDLTGYQIKDCEIDASDEFILLQPGVELPDFYWFEITGNSSNDFSILKKKLLISDRAYSFLNQFNIKNATTTNTVGNVSQ